MSTERGHAHGASADADRRWLTGALVVIVAFMLGEVVVGVMASSLALISDAAHMLTDAASIVLALRAIRLAARPAAGQMTHGWKRVEILSTQANGLTLLLLAAWLDYEAIRRLIHPPEVTGTLVLITALVGIVVKIAASWMIRRANRTSLNAEGAFQHILNDLFAFMATAVAGGIILLTGFWRADAIATLIVVALMVKAGIGPSGWSARPPGSSWRPAPKHLDPTTIGQAMATRDSVVEVHDLHIWEITSGSPALSAHVLVEPGRDCHAAGRPRRARFHPIRRHHRRPVLRRPAGPDPPLHRITVEPQEFSNDEQRRLGQAHAASSSITQRKRRLDVYDYGRCRRIARLAGGATLGSR
ncbi:Cadmium%2C cobalt and zinc/H [Mycobacteroides abscessus]|uniref:cation diffusion facilitator family transporter n=1 Tax=Mycobacteriaceae TaxID=1762 RepID=UPI0002DC6484|nr:cation diffusion facilitator family transporter [Mycobacteroides abscessus]CPT79202.1 Cadmium%2C cobalt and zinc/H [Mycobacteroides abscessus]CPU63258.1 Cadmium%2C cobalt and zinc/H [Mycobacteroides abscessus]SKK67819.1 Cadmium, cobalt and zinc/H [Mycobacteroides abscessus subsp. massiliense]SKQ42491.1 Cadmium, cobalt and zinc/H [Mycobacteroides abscessus subsp. massiliense]SKW99005.1 Cadmium, cobalt and zinc/H [Mycobacteroides abscessus subsp. massiliense]